MRKRQLLEELILVWSVDRIPESATARQRLVDVLRCRLSAWFRGEFGRYFFGERCVEGVKGIDRSWDAVEADALEADFSDELGILDGRVGIFCGRDAMKNGQ